MEVYTQSGTRQESPRGSTHDSQPYERSKEHANHTLRLLERFREANGTGELPSTARLQREGVFGQRPVDWIPAP
jgi:hypothetical protein